MANSEGGILWLGVEDNGEISGLHPVYRSKGFPSAMIANRTVPPLGVHCEEFEIEGILVLRIDVPQASGLVGTTDGRYARRRLKFDGSPESVPMTPYEIQQRSSHLGTIDPSAQLLCDVPLTAIDPPQRERIRNVIRRYNSSNKALLELLDDEFDQALGFVRNSGSPKNLTLAGVLFLTNEQIIREHVPTHEAAFQVLKNTNVLVNIHTQKPLLEIFEDFEQRFQAKIEENEFMDGLFRVQVPNYDLTAFREAFVNALVHRDYSHLGTVIVKLDESGLEISNPGGFVDGITQNNLLTVLPQARNFRLADIAKRIGLAERAGRGIDRIYEGLLRYGRPTPDYSRTTSNSVQLFIADYKADFPFLELILNQEAVIGKNLSIDTLIIMAALRRERRLTVEDLAHRIQKNTQIAHAEAKKLLEQGLIEAVGNRRSKTYMLSKIIYENEGKNLEYVKQKGFSTIQNEQMVLSFLEIYGEISSKDIQGLCRLTRNQAYLLIKNMKAKSKIISSAEKGRSAKYVLPKN